MDTKTLTLTHAAIHQIELALVAWACHAEATTADRAALAEFRQALQLAVEAEAQADAAVARVIFGTVGPARPAFEQASPFWGKNRPK